MMERDRRFIIEGPASFSNQASDDAYYHSTPGAEDNVVQEQLAELEKRSVAVLNRIKFIKLKF